MATTTVTHEERHYGIPPRGGLVAHHRGGELVGGHAHDRQRWQEARVASDAFRQIAAAQGRTWEQIFEAANPEVGFRLDRAFRGEYDGQAG